MYRQNITISINAAGDAVEYHVPHGNCDQFIGRDKFTADTTYEQFVAAVGRTVLMALGGLNDGLAERYPCLRVPPRPAPDTSLMTPQELAAHQEIEELKRRMDQEIADVEARLDAEDD